MKRAFVTLLTVALARCVYGTTCPASPVCITSSLSQSVVSAAVAAAVDGDEIDLPAGTVTWNSTISVVNKGISIIGAGIDQTIITSNVDTGCIFVWKNQGSTNLRLSGLTINCSDDKSLSIALVGPIFNARVDHCKFNKGDAAVRTNAGGQFTGQGPVYGVVDHCQFYNMGRPVFAMDVRVGDGVNAGAAAWTEFLADPASFPGSNKMMYYEDCQFIWDANNTNTNSQGFLYGQNGGKACVRHCSTTGTEFLFDAHGDSIGQYYGTIYYEIYNNTFGGTPYFGGFQGGEAVWMRGGQLIMRDNTIASPQRSLDMSVFFTNDLTAHRVQHIYFDNNINGGDATQADFVHVKDSGQTPVGYSAANIRLNTEYFLHAPQTGNTYFPYTAYTYPHPLVGASPTPTPAGVPVIVSQPSPVTINVGQVPTYNVQIGSTGLTNTFQWKKNGINIGPARSNGGVFGIWNGPNGSTASVLTDSGDKYSCTISNSAGAVTSNEALETVLPTPPFTLPTWNSTEGSVQSPFVRSGTDYIWQLVATTTDPLLGGSAIYPFTVVTDGDYWITGNVNCKDGASNSFYVGMDAEPTSLMVWGIPTTTGFEDRDVIISPETTKHIYHLTIGTHKLYLRGREAEAQIGDITVTLVTGPTPTPTPTPTPPAAIPMFSPDGNAGPFITSQAVTLSNATRGGAPVMHYTLTGEDLATADPSHILTYSTPVSLTISGLIKSVTSATGYLDSPQATSQWYEIKVATPVITGAGSHVGNTTVTLSDATPNSVGYYSIDGSVPSIQYVTGVVVSGSCTFQSQWKKFGCTDSDIVSATVTITIPVTPTPTPTVTPTPTATISPPPQTFIGWDRG